MAVLNADPRAALAARAAEIVRSQASAFLDHAVNVDAGGNVTVGRYTFPQPAPAIPPPSTPLVVDHNYPILDTTAPSAVATPDFTAPVYDQPATPPSDDTAAFNLVNERTDDGEANTSTNSGGAGQGPRGPGRKKSGGKGRKKVRSKKGKGKAGKKVRAKKAGKKVRAKKPAKKRRAKKAQAQARDAHGGTVGVGLDG